MHHHPVRTGQEQRMLIQPNDVAPGADALSGTQIELEELHLVDPADPLHRLQQLGDRGGVQVRVEEPPRATGPAGQQIGRASCRERVCELV